MINNFFRKIITLNEIKIVVLLSINLVFKKKKKRKTLQYTMSAIFKYQAKMVRDTRIINCL